jgi:hypothetical protein
VKIIKHENFLDSAANLVIAFERIAKIERTLFYPHEVYGDGVKPEEWLGTVGNQAIQHRPAILTMDDGIRANRLRINAMRESGCIFIFLTKAWSGQRFPLFAWKILRVWPNIVQSAEVSHLAARLCRIDVPINGQPHITNY